MNTNQEQELTQNPVSESGEDNQTIEEGQKGELYKKIISFFQTIPSSLNNLFTALFKANYPSKPVDEGTFSQKTERIHAYSDFIKSASKFIWIGVVFIIIIQLWGNFSLNHISDASKRKSNIVTITIPEQKLSQMSDDVANALGKALVSARASASNNLEQWHDEVMRRVDHPFLDWYYNYFTQWGVGVEAIWVNISGTSEEEKAEKLIGNFQNEFTKKVLQPSSMQLEMERFTREAIDKYVSEANQKLAGIQSQYQIPRPVWEEFLEGLGSTTYNTGSKEQNLSIRALSRGTGYVAASAMMKAVSVIGTKKIATGIVSKGTSKVVTKIATKTATKVATEGTGEVAAGLLGLELLNPIAGLGVLAWDIWDHYHTVKVERPILRENLDNYLNEVKDSLLNDKENGILSSVNKFHDGILDTLNSKPILAK
ncbi:hypothetical protein CDG76_22350 [Nostoc sp. 'Peltigera membranacea cyanobiont' 210A]|uniref:hypothetical protein n=1 Tax=Nostoc sp. 'Peltigera membranacea cyanobiont' 210A TaxID=2014529 RepID=UPI000B95262C|nr:hypothetical protein [Nostoc sp. 'Peltigera membranacea cyanobiont' 210A]OYD92301.1 hypothetical protein CDG76_22350 [Nostoc sp. 'Peltigera membranacea cyanobiont' 210A]